MAISEVTIKLLWGRAGGHCSKPSCTNDLTAFLPQTGDFIFGEMAHIIPHSEGGPRNGENCTREKVDDYTNLILLCPTHHTIIDKSPADYPRSLLIDWKEKHEERVRSSLKSPIFDNCRELFKHINRIIIQNRVIHRTYGPDSPLAQQNPLSDGYRMWNFLKLGKIVPNNRRIVNAIEANEHLVDVRDLELTAAFILHADAFEKNCYIRMESASVIRFPIEFQTLVEARSK